MLGWGSWTVRLAAGLVIGGVLGGVSAPTVVAGEPRQVLGTISVQGNVWSRDLADTRPDAGAPLTHSGVALLEGMVVATGAKSAALLNLSGEGMIGLRADGAVETGKRDVDGLHLTLQAGEILVRLPARSHVTLATATALIRPDTMMPVVAGPVTAAEASVKLLPSGETVVRVETGSLRIEGAEGGPAIVRAGEQATLAPDAAPRLVEASTAPPTAKVAAAAGKRKDGVFAADGNLALLIGLGSAVVVGGTLGGLAASGEFSGNGHDGASSNGGSGHDRAPSTGGSQGSAFRTPR